MNINGQTILDASSALENISNTIKECVENIREDMAKLNTMNSNLLLKSVKLNKSCNYMYNTGVNIGEMGLIAADIGSVYDEAQRVEMGRSL